MNSIVQSFENIKSLINNSNVKIVAVSKTFTYDHIKPLVDHGHIHFGENKVQEAQTKWKNIKKDNRYQSSITPCIEHLPDTNFWHYSLQLNTYKYILEKNYGERVVGMYLVCLHPNNANKSYIRSEVPHLPSEMADLMALRREMVKKIEQ